MLKAFLKYFASRTFYRVGAVRTILAGPCKGLRYRIFPGYGLAPLRGGWEREAQALMLKHISADAVVYDVGANYGIHTLLMARLATNGHVYAFEPLPEIFTSLKENIMLNGFDNVSCIAMALSDHSGVAEFVRGHHGGAGHLREANPMTGDTMSVATITIDDFVFQQGNQPPTFVKIDVEGAESQVLGGASKILNQVRPTLLIDLHTPEQDVAIGEALLQNRYDAFRTEDGQAVEDLGKGWPEPNGLWGQVIAIPRL